MKRYTLKFSGPNIYICCNGETIACFVKSPQGQGDTQHDDARCAIDALQKAAGERFTNAAIQTEQTK